MLRAKHLLTSEPGYRKHSLSTGASREAPVDKRAHQDCNNTFIAELKPSRVCEAMWQKYPTIDDTVDVEKIRRSAAGLQCVAVEKVDGSNFAFESDGREVIYYSRNRRIEFHEPFQGKVAPYAAMHGYHSAVVELFRISGVKRSIVVYGEYFGGWHPSATGHGPGAGTPVQSHVAYSPEHHFYAFDVLADGAWVGFDEAIGLLSRAGFPLIAESLMRGTFEQCLAVDVDRLETSVPGRLGFPHCGGHQIAEGVIVRPTRRRQPNEARTWIKKKSWQFLEERPNELAKALREPADFANLCLHFCVQPRLDNVLSHEPQLRMCTTSNVQRAQELFWSDVQCASDHRVSMVGKHIPSDCCSGVRVEANRLVAEWLQLSELDAPPPMPSRLSFDVKNNGESNDDSNNGNKVAIDIITGTPLPPTQVDKNIGVRLPREKDSKEHGGLPVKSFGTSSA